MSRRSAFRLGVLLSVCAPGCRGEALSAPAEDAAAPISDPLPEVESSADVEDGTGTRSGVEGDWCTDGLEVLDEETCFVLPSELRAPRTLLVYLHGVIAPRGKTQTFVQQTVRAHALAHGYAALLPRGRQGIAPPKVRDWWAWPTDAAAHERFAKAMVEGWLTHRRVLERFARAEFERTYLAGSSNGAYFAAVLALRGEIAVDGFAAIAGGSRGSRAEGQLASVPQPPFFIGYGAQDDAKGDPIGLAALLKDAGWPHVLVERPVGHGLREVYLDDAFAYWARTTAAPGQTAIEALHCEEQGGVVECPRRAP